MRGINHGWRWENNKLVFRKGWEEEDIKAGLSTEAVTTRAMMMMMNSIYSNLKFEMETESMFSNGRLPTLDFTCWVVNNKVLYSFFQKPMARKTVINRQSALSEKTKVTSLSQDLIRRMKNTSEDLPMDERIAIIDEYTKQLIASGYSLNQTKNIIESGLLGYETLVRKVEKGDAVLHRSASEGAGARKRKKLLGKGNWFVTKKRSSFMDKQRKSKTKEINKEKEKDYTTVLFVSQTPKGILAKRLQKAENDISKLTGDRVKVVERGGTSIRRILVKSNPWAGSLCGRENCLPCMFGDGKQDCFSKGVVYDMTCTSCEEEANDRGDVSIPIYKYTGTTARSLHERGAEHLKSFKNGDHEKSFMLKHSIDKHNGKFVEFSMKVVKKHYSAFSRLIHEAVRIERNSRDLTISSLNSKSEFGRGNLPRLVIDEPEKVNLKKIDTLFDVEVNDGIENDFKMKERNEKTETVDGSKDVPSRDHLNSSFNFVDLLHKNFDTLPTAASNNKPNIGCGGKHFNRQKSELTRHNSSSKVRKRRPS